MEKKKLIAIVIIACLIIAVLIMLTSKKSEYYNTDNISNSNIPIIHKIEQPQYKKNEMSESQITTNKQQNAVDNAINKNTIDTVKLSNSILESNIPLSAMSLISALPQNIQQQVIQLSNTHDIYMVQKINNKLLIITDNPANIRHNIAFTEIKLDNGHQSKTTLGYNGKIKDSDNDIWEFNQTTSLPLHHNKYNSNGDLEFTEIWNYESDNPIKYEMKDSEGNVISLKKETNDSAHDLRIEHLLYDNNGNIKMNISATYVDNEIIRFTYFNSDNIDESGSIFSEYTDGIKTKEILYTSDLKVKNSYTSDSKNGEIEGITVLDKNDNEIMKITAVSKEANDL